MEKFKQIITAWLEKRRQYRHARREAEMKMLYNITLRGNEVYVICGNVAVHLFSSTDRIADVVTKVNAVRETAIKYEDGGR
jgi:hypothetical protein